MENSSSLLSITTKRLGLLIIASILLLPIAACSSKPEPEPLPSQENMKPEKPEKVVTVKQPVQEPVPESNLTDDAISKASREAKKKLPELRKAFNAGLQPGEFILVKAPFKAPDGGQEWMWVEVTSWNGSQIKGLLQNEPVYIPDLHSGQIVNVNEEDVFDYMRQDAKGNIEGNETGKLMVEEQPSE